ncbi:MAG: hypothetical protein IAG13_19365, partial [Deltaproteobacteria bacterium]|nr:hypothetical protein [Nannocystaceae bacterium]
RPEPPSVPSSAQRIHLQAPGVADVVGEPDSQLYWQRRDDGRVVLELREGIAWVRRAAGGAELGVIAGGDEVVLAGTCTRIEVTRRLLSVDATIDDVECGRVDEAIEQVRAELSDAGPR